MKQEKIIMGMTIRIEIVDPNVNPQIFDKIFSYFEEVDQKFSTYKKDSEISKINEGVLKEQNYSEDMREIFYLAEQTKQETHGYFDIKTPDNTLDTCGIVKGWAIKNAAEILKGMGYRNFYLEAGGDIEVSGTKFSQRWQVGIRHPHKPQEVVKVLSLENKGIATSGNYVHENHIYNPNGKNKKDIVSLTVIGPNIYEADRFATAAFAMGRNGIFFIENLPGLEGYMIDKYGIATMTSNFEKYLA